MVTARTEGLLHVAKKVSPVFVFLLDSQFLHWSHTSHEQTYLMPSWDNSNGASTLIKMERVLSFVHAISVYTSWRPGSAGERICWSTT